MKRCLAALVALTFPASLPAASPQPRPTVAPAKPAPMTLTPGVRRNTLSAEGRAIAQRIMRAPDPRIAQVQGELEAIRAEKLKMAAGPSVDLGMVESLLRREQALQAELRTRNNDLLLTLLRALSDADRLAVLQNQVNPAKLQNSKPAEPAR